MAARRNRNKNKRKIIIKEKGYQLENDVLAFFNRYILYIVLLIIGIIVVAYYA